MVGVFILIGFMVLIFFVLWVSGLFLKFGEEIYWVMVKFENIGGFMV